MDFSLTREQEMLRDMVREFAQNELAPRVLELDKKGEFPFDIARRMGELGLLGISAPREYGGSGADLLSLLIVLEELAKVYPSMALFCMAAAEDELTLQMEGSEEMKRRFIPQLIKAEKICSFALTEATGGSEPTAMQTTAERIGDEYVLNGRKILITLALLADLAFIEAKTQEGISAFLVEKGTPGFVSGRREDLIGFRAIPIGEFILTNCKIPKQNLMGKEGGGLTLAMTVFNLLCRPSFAAMSLGIAEGAYEVALSYAKERKLYGAPISRLQAIQFMLVDMEVAIETARWFCYHTAWLIDQGKSSREVAKDVAMAKLYTTDVAKKVTIDAMSVLGGYGTALEYQLAHRLHDALEIVAGVGTQEIMKATIGASIIR